MDDLTVTTTSVMGGRWLLKGLERNMTRARMYFKPAKSRSLVLKKDNETSRSWRKSDSQSQKKQYLLWACLWKAYQESAKSLGKTFNSSLKDTAAKQKTIKVWRIPWGKANENRQIWIAWSILGMVIPACSFVPDIVAIARLWHSDYHRGIVRESN